MVIREHRHFKPAAGAALAVLCGLALWFMPLGEPWVNASYDYLFRFGSRMPTNNVVVLLMDDESYNWYGLSRNDLWPRAHHTELLNRLADEGCPLVVFDVNFDTLRDPDEDGLFANALRRQNRVILMAEKREMVSDRGIEPVEGVDSATPTMPVPLFLDAVRTNWGVACFDKDLDRITRRHWPFPAPGPFPSLSWTVARLTDAQLDYAPREQWLRYYGIQHPWSSLSYHLATNQVKNYFHDKIVFIGNKPSSTVPDDGEGDKFSTPYTRWTGEAVGGVELIVTAYLNLRNDEWLRRPPVWLEIVVLVLSGIVLGGGLCLVRVRTACGLALGGALVVTLGAAWFSQKTNFWFPWLVVAGGQIPAALTCALAVARVGSPRQDDETTVGVPSSVPTGYSPAPSSAQVVASQTGTPDATDYEIFTPHFAEGAFGKVWIVRNSVHQWQALKAVYLSNFGPNSHSYEREFSGIEKYKPISDKHPALLRVDFVSMKKPEGYFYYVMELGDALNPGWEQKPSSYVPKDLAKVRATHKGKRLPVRECVRIGLSLTAGLQFLHQQGLTHRDVKPQNIIFVKGEPKLADVGLVAEIRPPGEQLTMSGTPGYMPPPPERPGTAVADIYGLGMVLYVILTGRDPTFFPEIDTTFVDEVNPAEFAPLNQVILKACDPDVKRRFASAAEMAAALLDVQRALGEQSV
jgi:CHASE2 domain-containing sensor protein